MKKMLLLLLICFVTFAQANEDWVLVSSSGNSTTYMNIKDLSSFTGEDVYVWTMEKHNPPFELESVGGDIYRTKTYYLFNKELQRYSLLQVIYYDEDDNVLKSFSYDRAPTNITSYKYNFPVFRGSDQEIILQKIYEITGAPEQE